tara:strand:+ start:207 stop:1175 length:969 start_codon:yes stop_codon:yes gene_type:complete
MNDLLSKEKLIQKFSHLGLIKGDTVFISSNIVALGKIAKAHHKYDYCEIYFKALMKVLGKAGTIVVPTYTSQVARNGEKFILEKTKSHMGIFAEHIRTKEKSIRSVHPVNSVAAYGKNSSFICKNNSTSDFGSDSPFDRLSKLNCKLLSIGLTSRYSVNILHYLEAMFCVPYRYNKLLDIKTFVQGKQDKRSFLINARYLDLKIKYDYSKWLLILYKNKKISGTSAGKGLLFMTKFNDALEIAKINMINDPYFFLKKKPNFIKGKIPYDGTTLKRENVIKKIAVKRIAKENNKFLSLYMGHNINEITEEDLILDQKIIKKHN